MTDATPYIIQEDESLRAIISGLESSNLPHLSMLRRLLMSMENMIASYHTLEGNKTTGVTLYFRKSYAEAMGIKPHELQEELQQEMMGMTGLAPREVKNEGEIVSMTYGDIPT